MCVCGTVHAVSGTGAARRLTPPRQLTVERLRYFIVKSFVTTLLNQELRVQVEPGCRSVSCIWDGEKGG